MLNFVRALVLSAVTVASGAALADAGGIPNAHACSPGNASHCGNGGAQVPEMDVAGLPVALGLITSLIMWRRDRRKNS
jgi:hypothetical protein